MNFWSFMVQNRDEVAQLSLEHLWIVGISTMFAVAIGIPLGILILPQNRIDETLRELAVLQRVFNVLSMAIYQQSDHSDNDPGSRNRQQHQRRPHFSGAEQRKCCSRQCK